MKIDKGLTKSPFNSNDIVQNINATDNTISGTVQNKAGGSSGTHSGNQAEQIIGQSQQSGDYQIINYCIFVSSFFISVSFP